MDIAGEFHVGEFINRFRRGNFTIHDHSNNRVDNLIYATVNGVLGVVVPISQEQHGELKKLEDAMGKVTKGVGGLSHSDWRAFTNERRTSPCSGFIDGDLIEAFLDLSRDSMEAVVATLEPKVSVEELTARVEELQRMH